MPHEQASFDTSCIPQRQLSFALEESHSKESKAMMLMLKLMETVLRFASVNRALFRVNRSLLTPEGLF